MTRKLFWRTRKKAPSARNLTSLALDDVRRILDSADLAKEWAAYAPRLSELCQIEDGKTGGVNPGDRRALFYSFAPFGRPEYWKSEPTSGGVPACSLPHSCTVDGSRSRVWSP